MLITYDSINISPILQLRINNLRSGKQLAQGHTAGKQQRPDVAGAVLMAKPKLLGKCSGWETSGGDAVLLSKNCVHHPPRVS